MSAMPLLLTLILMTACPELAHVFEEAAKAVLTVPCQD